MCVMMRDVSQQRANRAFNFQASKCKQAGMQPRSSLTDDVRGCDAGTGRDDGQDINFFVYNQVRKRDGALFHGPLAHIAPVEMWFQLMSVLSYSIHQAATYTANTETHGARQEVQSTILLVKARTRTNSLPQRSSC